MNPNFKGQITACNSIFPRNDLQASASATVGSNLFQHTASTMNKVSKRAPPSQFKVSSGENNQLSKETQKEEELQKTNTFANAKVASVEEVKSTPHTSKTYGLNTAKRNAAYAFHSQVSVGNTGQG